MIIRRFPVLVLVLWSALALLAQTQDTGDTQIIDEDFRVTSVEGRQRAVANLLNTAVELRKSGQLVEAARTLNRVGQFQIRMFVAEEAVATFQEALKLLEQQPDPKTYIDSLNGLSSSYDNLSKCDLAEPPANQATTLGKQNNYVAGQAQALLILSDCQDHRDHALALKSAQESLALWSSIHRQRGMADASVMIGNYQLAQHNLVECAVSMETALALFRELNDVDEQAEVLINLGFIEYRKGAWQNALGYYTQAQSIIDEKAEPYKMGQIAIGLGDVFLESGMPDVALPKYREALDYFRITKNQRAVSVLKWSIGKAYYVSGQYTEAIESLQAARSEAESSRDIPLLAFCDDFLGRTYHASNQDAAALSHFQSALEGYSKAKNRREVARTQALMGLVYQQQGSLQKARDNYQTALDTFRLLADRVNESATLFAMGDLELKEKNLDKASDYLQQSIEVTEQMRRVSTSGDLTTAFSATVHNRYETYIECLMRKHYALPADHLDVRAFETSELARGRSLAELLRRTQTNLAPGLDPQLAERERSLRQTLSIKENYKITLLAKQYTPDELKALESELTRLEADYKQVNDTITARYPSYTQMNRPTGWSLSQIQQQVIPDDQTVLLEYSLGSEQSYVWAVTRNSIKSHPLPAQSQITEAAQKVYRLLAAFGDAPAGASSADAERESELARATQALGQMVLSPVAAELNKQRVIVVADGALNYIPFQILPTSSSGNEPLVASAEVINAPSASILGQLRVETAQRQAHTKVLAAFGNPVFASNYPQFNEGNTTKQLAAVPAPENEHGQPALRDIEVGGDSFNPAAIQPLIYATRELANLREVAGPESFMFTGFDATREKLAAADLTKYAILHFATHGVLDTKRPENSGLYLSMVNREGLAQNGFVGLQDIYSLHAPVDLVVLSACRTGLGKDVRGEGLIGLTRGFMYAGASSVVASLWKVDDEATAELMKRFYANMLQGGMTPAAALREAQNNIRQQPQWRSPYFWAAFTLQGEYLQQIKAAPASYFSAPVQIVFGLSLLLLLAAAAWRYGRSFANQ